ncbi:MAG: hypothetical protein HY858_10140 [Candidatus Solibacter usitatus]|nr:hypothetical protein [Candidatus Solibacter usitatus]
MKCKFCGTKVGVFERWRYGDFCTERHREEFAEDLSRLNAQIVKDLRRIPAMMKAAGTEEACEPPQAWLVAEPEQAPVAMGREREVLKEAPCARPRNDEWKALARIAEWDDLPVAALAASRKRQSRFIPLSDGAAPVCGPAGSLVEVEWAVFLPSPELRQFRLRMSTGGLKTPEKWSKPATCNCGWKAAGGMPAWIDDHGWRWISEGGPAAAPRMEAVLTEAPLRAPWLNWEFVAPRRGEGQAQGGATPGYGVLPFMGEAYPAQAQPAQPAWRMMAPPLFNALVDVAHGLAVTWSGEAFASPAVPALVAEAEPRLPVMDEAPHCGIPLVDCQDDLSADERAAQGMTAVRRPLLNTLWRRQLNMPGLARTLGRPRVPPQAAREIRLPIGVAPELPPAGIEAFAKRRAH